MSLLARNLRTVARRAGTRSFATTGGEVTVKPTEEWLAEHAAHKQHAAETTELWRKVSFYICIPGIIVCGIWTYNVEKAHFEHMAHAKHENGGKLPEQPAYDYLNRRSKPFPWGMNSLFFNPEVNKDLTAEE